MKVYWTVFDDNEADFEMALNERAKSGWSVLTSHALLDERGGVSFYALMEREVAPR